MWSQDNPHNMRSPNNIVLHLSSSRQSPYTVVLHLSLSAIWSRDNSLTLKFYTSHHPPSDPETIPLHYSSTPLTVCHLIPRDNPLTLKFYTSHRLPSDPETIPLHCSSTHFTVRHLISRQSPYTKVLHHLTPRQSPYTVVLQLSPFAIWSWDNPLTL